MSRVEEHLVESMRKHGEKHKKEKEKKSSVHRMEIEKADSGGFVVKHHKEHESGRYEEPEVHVVKNSSALKKHVVEHMGESESDEEAGELK